MPATEGWFQLLVDAAPNANVVVDASGTIVLVNASAERLFGYASTELVGRSVSSLIPERYRGAHAGFVASYGAAPAARSMGSGRELFARRKDGREVPVEIGLAPLTTQDGAFVLASIIDITARRQIEDELRRSNAELEQFAHIASHDLQEPLRMVASFTELLAERYGDKLDDTAHRYIRFAVDGAHRMQQLVADLLSYSRVGRDNAPRALVNLNVVLAEVWVSLGSARQSAPGATMRKGDLPSVVAAESQMRQLFQNLVGNSLKFRSDAPPVIDVSARRVDDGWEIAVKDNGIGFDRSDSERVFQMFQRLHGRSAYEGSGIGLAIAKRIVESHGGRIGVDSAPGEGSTFYVVLPSGTDR